MPLLNILLWLLCGLFFTNALADDTNASNNKMRIACVGDSITFGARATNPATDAYPAQLAKILGDNYEVGNFGVSGRTLMQKGDLPYRKVGQFAASKEFNPHIVIIKLGTNDTKSQNWAHKADFIADYLALIDEYEALPTKPQIFLCTPCPVIDPQDNNSIHEAGVKEVIAMVKKIAKQKKLEIIDVYGFFNQRKDKKDLLPDRIHPNTEGYRLMAEFIAKNLQNKIKQKPVAK